MAKKAKSKKKSTKKRAAPARKKKKMMKSSKKAAPKKKAKKAAPKRRRAEAQGCYSETQGCCSEARRAEACGQSDAGACTSASTRSVAGAVMDSAVGVQFRRFWRRRYKLALARSLTRRLAIEPAPRQTRWNRVASGRIACAWRGQ